jgi:hypothetical protein
MTNTYLLEIIRAMKPKLQVEMTLFLESTLFNGGGNAMELKKLYQTIIASAPDFKDEFLNKETIYFQVFSDPAVVQGKLEKLMVELNKLLRTFLLTKRYWSEKNDAQHQVDWQAWLREEGLGARAQILLSKLKIDKQVDGEESLERYRLDLMMAEEKHELKSIQNQVNGDLGIPELITSLDLYYFNYRKELFNRYLLQQKGIPLPDLDHEIKSTQYFQDSSLLFLISSRIGELLSKDRPSPEEFQDLLQLLKEHERRIPFQTQAQLFVYLRNLCTLLINSGQIAFAEILHQIHQDNLDRGLFFINGEISPHSYINIVQIAIRVKEYAWAKEFTDTFKQKIIGGDKEQFFYRFNLSHCLFAEGKLEEALDHLPEPSSHSHYHGTIRRLELKIYYELRSDLLNYKLYAFRKYFERTATKSVPANHRSMYIEFFNILLQLSQSPLKDKARSERLIERIQKKKLLADRAWLLEKAKELG